MVLLVPLPTVFTYHMGVVLSGPAHSHIVQLIANSKLAVCIGMYFLSTACHGALSSQTLDPTTVLDPSVLVALFWAFLQLIDNSGYLRIVSASSLDPVLFYNAYYGRDN